MKKRLVLFLILLSLITPHASADFIRWVDFTVGYPALRQALFCPQRPVYGKENDSPSGYIDPDGGCVNSLIADGCDIRGSVKNCILFRNVRIEKGASVENCILFKDTVVKRGAILRGVITDKYVTVSENVTLMGHERYPIVIAKGATV